MKYFTLIVTSLFLSLGLKGQYLISDSLIATSSIPGAAYEAEVYKIVYQTIDPQGDPTIASGSFSVPKDAECDWPLLSYQHGTILNREDVPSRLGSEAPGVGDVFATDGYAVAMPDYLGLGDSPGIHPYMHARTHASCVIDLLRACKEFCEKENILLNGQLFLFGYSQGGHATMAAHMMMQLEFPEEFPVTASAPASGPYDVSGVQTQVLVDTIPYGAPGYLPYVVYGFQEAYGDLFTDPSDIFKSPYDTIIPPYMNGTYNMADLDAVMPAVPNQVLTDSVFQEFLTNMQHPIRVHLREQDVYEWVPTAPVRMLYCTEDELVSYENAIVAEDWMSVNGATNVEAVSMLPGLPLGHNPCTAPVLIDGKSFFDGLRASCSVIEGRSDLRSNLKVEVFPNPASDHVVIRIQDIEETFVRVCLKNMMGQTLMDWGALKSTTHTLSTKNIPSGMYLLEFTRDQDHTFKSILIY